MTIAEAAARADRAFWAEVADCFPDVPSGDLSPMDSTHIRALFEQFITIWLIANDPTRRYCDPQAGD